MSKKIRVAAGLAAALLVPAAVTAQPVTAGGSSAPAAHGTPTAAQMTAARKALAASIHAMAVDAKAKVKSNAAVGIDWTKLFQVIQAMLTAYEGYKDAVNAPLPPINPVSDPAYAQNLSPEEQDWFRTTPQGTYLMPYSWFMALEQPEGGKSYGASASTATLSDLPAAWQQQAKPTGLDLRFHASKYLAHFGMLNLPKSDYNPDGLPAGLTMQKDFVDPSVAGALPETVLGLGCALCHSGKVEYNNKTLYVDGGPAQTNMELFGTKFVVAILQTLLPDQITLDPLKWTFSRFNRFAYVVNGNKTPSKLEWYALYLELADFAVQNAMNAGPSGGTPAGFARLDALDAIGNQVFGVEVDKSNMVATTAPVSYPMIWTVPWLAWAEYPGVVRNPMIRNVGEALGVKAPINLTTGDAGLLYKSTAMVGELYKFESLLMEGTHDPKPDSDPWEIVKKTKALPGLQPPSWSAAATKLGLPPIDARKAEAGKQLYAELCEGCHLPPLNDPAIGATDKDGNLNPDYWDSKAADEGMAPLFRRQFLRVKKLNIQEIGTDPQEVVNFATNFPNLTNMSWGKESGIVRTMDTTVPSTSKGEPPVQKVGQVMSMADGLKYITQAAANRWYADNNITSSAAIAKLEGYRPNQVLLEPTYRARPLDGIWATGPYLHNGSVANLYQLLLPASQRAKQFVVGLTEFDPKNVGFTSYEGDTDADKTQRAARVKEGYTLFSVDDADGNPIKGNSNAGHEFTGDGKVLGNGIVGRALTDEQRYDLIEYLKTL